MPSRSWFAPLLVLVAAGAFGETLAGRGAVVLITPDSAPLASVDDARVHMTEVGGRETVVRVSPVDESGQEIGSGRIVTLLPSEEREIRLADKFAPEALAGARLQVEVLRGDGRISVDVRNPAGRVLIADLNAAATTKRRAVAPHVPSPSSVDLIDQAAASGKIDAETALLYRVYAIHGDARLPNAYRGVDQPIPDTLYMNDVRTQFDSLSPGVQALVAPFLIPPAYQESWVNIKAGGAQPVRTSGLPPCHLSSSWAFVDATDSPVRVWYDSEILADAANAGRAAADIDKIWPIEIGLMHKVGTTTGFPVSDGPETCNGGNDRVDIYLTDFYFTGGEADQYSRCNGTPSAAYMEVPRDAPTATLIHELFHVITMSYPLLDCDTSQDYRWWTEGSATWAIDYVASVAFPGIQAEQIFANYYVSDPKKKLDLFEGFIANHAYSTYLLPFYLSRSSANADFVRVAWENCAKKPAIEAFDAAVPGGLEKVWPKFVEHNWNRPPVDDYEKWDNLLPKVAAEEVKDSSTAGEISLFKLDYDLPHTTSTYFRFDYTGYAAPSVVFWNGVTTKLAERDISGGALGPQYVNDPASSGDTKGAHVTALLRTGTSWREEDWTDKPFVMFCRDTKDNTFDEMVIVISNSNTDRNRDLKPPGLPPLLFVSNMGCYQWKGTTMSTDGGLSTNADVTFTRVPESTGPLAVHYTAEGGLNWSITSAGCNTAGSLSLPGGGTSKLTTYNFLPPDNPAHGTYAGGGLTAPVKVCSGETAFSWMASPPQPFVPGIPLARWLHVSEDGQTLEDAYFDIKGAHWQWHLEREKQH